MYYITWYIVDDNKGGWCPPSDNSGKVFVTVRKWTTDLQHAQPTDKDLEDFMWFLDKYVSHAVGNHHFMQCSKSNRTKTFLDKVTASDIAYTILVYENSHEVWKEELQIRATSWKKTGIMKEGGNIWRDTGIARQKMDGSIINYCLGFLKT